MLLKHATTFTVTTVEFAFTHLLVHGIIIRHAWSGSLMCSQEPQELVQVQRIDQSLAPIASAAPSAICEAGPGVGPANHDVHESTLKGRRRCASACA